MMLRAPLRFAFRKLGRRYPRIAMVVQFQFAHVIAMGGVGLLLLYVDMSGGEFGRIVAVSQGLLLLENTLAVRAAFKLVRPADPWLRGDRSAPSAIAAFRALAGLPLDFLRSRRWQLLWSLVPISVFIAWEVDEGWWPALPIIVVGASVVLLYGALLRFLALELMMRPVLEQISDDLPDDAQLGRATIPLQRRLLLVLPAINIITGVVVSGLASPGQDGLTALGFGVLLAVGVAFTLSFELSLLLARSIVEPLSDLRKGADAVARGDLSVRVPVLGTDEAGALAMSFNTMVAGLQEREKLHGALAAFVDPQVTGRILAEGHELPGEEVEVSILFLDIRGFTGFAERASAAEVVERLNDFYGLVVPLLIAHGGHVNKFIGDGLLAVFGAPSRLEGHADRAVSAALTVARSVRERYGNELRIGVGVNSGLVVAGTIGGGGRVDFTVIGDAVNTAARVEEATRTTGDDLLLTAGTRALLTADHGGFVAREGIRLKGKRDEVVLYAPLAAATDERERSIGRHDAGDPARVARP